MKNKRNQKKKKKIKEKRFSLISFIDKFSKKISSFVDSCPMKVLRERERERELEKKNFGINS